MAFTGKLRLGGVEYNLLHCDFTFKRDINEKGKPSSKLYGSFINLIIESSESTFLIEYVLNNQSRPIDGSVIITNVNQERNTKEISFRNGYVIEYTEKIEIVNVSSQVINLTISAKTFRIGSAEHKNEWSG